MSIKIVVATHKLYQMPEDGIYIPIHAGKELSKEEFGYIGDDNGDNISVKNRGFCELTALYWAWNNLDADYIGLSHYRRHFSKQWKGDKWLSVLNDEEASELCGRYDVIVPNKRRYYIETNYSHYIHAHKKEGLDKLVEIIKRDYPDYSAVCDTVLNRTWAHMFNMSIMKRNLLREYCAWLFDILLRVEKELDTSQYSTLEKRVFSYLPDKCEARVFCYLSELMLDMWLEKNKIPYAECRVLYMEKQNWLVKGAAFVYRKIFHANS